MSGALFSLYKANFFPLGAKHLLQLEGPIRQNPCIQNRQGCWDIRADLK
jgi:hypothetical protein